MLITIALSLHSQQPVKILDFYIGMNKEDVKALYTRMKEAPVAEYVSIEPGQYRDQIKVDNEFSSMGNKIDILYDDNGKVNSITFQYKTVDILLNASGIDPAGLAEKLTKDLGIKGFKQVPVGTGKGYEYTGGKVKITVDSYRNIKMQVL